VPVLLCDLDDTLFDHERATRDALDNLRGGYQVLTRWSLDELDSRHRVLLESIHIDVLNGRLSIEDARRERFGRLLAQAGVEDRAATEAIAGAYREAYASKWQPVPGAIEFLCAVRAAGYAIVIVTNNGVAEQQLKLVRCGFDGLVDAMVTSEEAGVSKPGRGIFAQALARVGSTSGEAVMLGDAWVADIEGARAIGVAPVWFNRAGRPSPDPTVAELASLAPAADAVAIVTRAGVRSA